MSSGENEKRVTKIHLAIGTGFYTDPNCYEPMKFLISEVGRLQAELYRNKEFEELHPAMCCGKCIRTLDALEQENKALLDALIWCSGSEDFSLNGKAREGWERIATPLLAPKPLTEKPE